MPRPSLVAIALAAAALTACADPTAPTDRSTTVQARKSGYVVTCGAKDSTSANSDGASQ